MLSNNRYKSNIIEIDGYFCKLVYHWHGEDLIVHFDRPDIDRVQMHKWNITKRKKCTLTRVRHEHGFMTSMYMQYWILDISSRDYKVEFKDGDRFNMRRNNLIVSPRLS